MVLLSSVSIIAGYIVLEICHNVLTSPVKHSLVLLSLPPDSNMVLLMLSVDGISILLMRFNSGRVTRKADFRKLHINSPISLHLIKSSAKTLSQNR